MAKEPIPVKPGETVTVMGVPAIAVTADCFNVKDFGAIGDGVADDTAAIQAAVTACVTGRRGGTVYAPIGKYRITSTVTLPDPDGGFQNAISIRGDGPTLTEFVWAGPSVGEGATATMFNVLGQAYCSYRGFGMRNGTGAGRAETCGFWYHGDAHSGGTTGGSAIFEHVSAAGFCWGIFIGSGLDAISELLFHMLVLSDNDIGLTGINFNSLDFTFVLLELGQNAIGIKADSAGCMQFFGGSSSNSTDTDFYLNTGGAFTINGFRSEGANRFVMGYTGALSIAGCAVSASTNEDQIAIETYELLSIVGCKIYGKIASTSQNGVSITGSYLGNGGDAGDQLLYPIKQKNLDLTHLYAFGNWGIGETNGSQAFSSRASIFNSSNIETTAWTIGTPHP